MPIHNFDPVNLTLPIHNSDPVNLTLPFHKFDPVNLILPFHKFDPVNLILPIHNFDFVNLILLKLILYSILVQICLMRKRTDVRRLRTHLRVALTLSIFYGLNGKCP